MKRKILWTAILIPVTLAAQTTLTSTAMQRYYNAIRRNLEASADLVPADKYNFKLTDGQETFGQWILHSAGRNYQDCAAIKGETPPHTEEQLNATLKDKPAIAQALKDSFTYCEPILAGLDDAKVLASSQTTYSFLHLIVHNNEVYGNIVGYMRTLGFVPPSTAGRGGRASGPAR